MTALMALASRRYRVARTAAMAQVSAILWGWVVAQMPLLVPPDLTITNVAAPASTLRLVLVALLLGLAALIPSLRYLFRVFKAEPVGASPTQNPDRPD